MRVELAKLARRNAPRAMQSAWLGVAQRSTWRWRRWRASRESQTTLSEAARGSRKSATLRPKTPWRRTSDLRGLLQRGRKCTLSTLCPLWSPLLAAGAASQGQPAVACRAPVWCATQTVFLFRLSRGRSRPLQAVARPGAKSCVRRYAPSHRPGPGWRGAVALVGAPRRLPVSAGSPPGSRCKRRQRRAQQAKTQFRWLSPSIRRRTRGHTVAGCHLFETPRRRALGTTKLAAGPARKENKLHAEKRKTGEISLLREKRRGATVRWRGGYFGSGFGEGGSFPPLNQPGSWQPREQQLPVTLIRVERHRKERG